MSIPELYKRFKKKPFSLSYPHYCVSYESWIRYDIFIFGLYTSSEGVNNEWLFGEMYQLKYNLMLQDWCRTVSIRTSFVVLIKYHNIQNQQSNRNILCILTFKKFSMKKIFTR